MIKFFKSISLFFLLILSPLSFSKYDLRKCLILPVTGHPDLEVSNRIYEETENYLKNVDWCIYKKNSDILDILEKYRENLDQHLNEKEVLLQVSQKSEAGALIRIRSYSTGSDISVEFKVFGENGEDIYYKNEGRFDSGDFLAISRAITGWLEAYEKIIPFHAQIETINEPKFRSDMGTNMGLNEGMEVQIIHPISPQRHPLLKEVVGWEKKDLGEGKITEAQRNESSGEIIKLIADKPSPGDWLVKTKEIEGISEKKEEKPKYGFISLALDVGAGVQNIYNSGFPNNFRGNLVGGYFKGEVWFFENLWLSLELDGRLGELEDEYNTREVNDERSFYKVKGGYRFLPSNNFYETHLDVYIGYGGYNYSPRTTYYRGPYDATFQGLIFGLRLDFPIGEKVRTNIEAEIISATGKSNRNTYGGTEPGYSLFVGGNYFFNPKFSGDLSLGGYNNRFENIVPGQNVKYYDYSLRLGTSFYF